MMQHGFTFSGERIIRRPYQAEEVDQIAGDKNETDINIYELSCKLMIFSQTRAIVSLVDWLEMPADLKWRVQSSAFSGLSTRIVMPSQTNGTAKGPGPKRDPKSATYNIWFFIPSVELKTHDKNPVFEHPLTGSWRPMPVGDSLWIKEEPRLFYMKWDVAANMVRIFTSLQQIDWMIATCLDAENLDVRADPFVLLTGAFSALLDVCVKDFAYISSRDQDKIDAALKLPIDISAQQEEQVKEDIINMRRLLPMRLRRYKYLEFLNRIIKEAIEHHQHARSTFEIPQLPFERVHCNMRAILSVTETMKAELEAQMTLWDNCISSLSNHVSLRNFKAINAHTDSLNRIAELGRKENIVMTDISRAARVDSEAMKVIAMLTMLYLPATFVATLFSMGIFHFDYDNGNSGRLGLSSQWWLYVVIALPLTLMTLFSFRFISDRNKKQQAKMLDDQDKQENSE
ncbi:hypothetical protein JDV02_002164 [Purpureocillium takamizusanense]|uniref:Uncharacterized protein n=1 Tax=Purpureocillium takamizusanense TaxID=2060973 RepID=A0A9Q8Q8R3_9HYPO|nr:uncharacterized protein JDV02_002164 [Purpureocillium takamizusanense]UNI15653.1 hypothetical protein JDV02_002164 [Purpureocillium takamizusanense]